jgi:hypothetical protein
VRILVDENARLLLLLVIDLNSQMQQNVHDIPMHVPNVAQLWRMTPDAILHRHASFCLSTAAFVCAVCEPRQAQFMTEEKKSRKRKSGE